jgi:hypothetical protein
MFKITLKHTGNELFNRIADLVGDEAGEVTGSPFTDGKQFYCAVFANYGEVTWIPTECCEVTEVSEPSASA